MEESSSIPGGGKIFFLFLKVTILLSGLANLIFRKYSKDRWYLDGKNMKLTTRLLVRTKVRNE
jgi:hypothetical protein